MRRIIERIDAFLSGIGDWAKGHEAFFAVKMTRLLAVVFIVVSFLFLLKSISNT